MKNYKKDFPIFDRYNDLVYCDSAATSQKPQSVINAIVDFYAYRNASIYRGIYDLSEQATRDYELVRQKVATYIGASFSDEIVFTRGATESINIVAQAWALHVCRPGDVIVLTELEHHSNIVPWQEVARVTGAIIAWVPVFDDGQLDCTNLDTIITKKARLVAVTAGSNVIGVPVDYEPLVNRARYVGAKVLIDAAQMAPRIKFNVCGQNFDFMAFSAHKMLGPSGLGVLFVRREIHAFLRPIVYGGGMISSVTKELSAVRAMPALLEAGTPAIAQVIALGAAIDYLNALDFVELQRHEARLCKTLLDGLAQFKQVVVVGSYEKIIQAGHCVTFTIQGMHAHDVAAYLNSYGIAVRSGNHCAQPLHDRLNIAHSVRVSFYLYNTDDDVEKIIFALSQLLG